MLLLAWRLENDLTWEQETSQKKMLKIVLLRFSRPIKGGTNCKSEGTHQIVTARGRGLFISSIGLGLLLERRFEAFELLKCCGG